MYVEYVSILISSPNLQLYSQQIPHNRQNENSLRSRLNFYGHKVEHPRQGGSFIESLLPLAFNYARFWRKTTFQIDNRSGPCVGLEGPKKLLQAFARTRVDIWIIKNSRWVLSIGRPALREYLTSNP